MAYSDTALKLAKLDPKDCPKVPLAVRGKNLRGLNGVKAVDDYINRRNAFAAARIAEGYNLTELSAVLSKSGHKISPSGLSGSLQRRGMSVAKTPANSQTKVRRDEVNAVAALINDLVEKRCAPLIAENTRLKKMEKQFFEFKKLLERV